MAIRILLLALTTVLAAALQSTVAPRLAVFGARPDLLLVLTVATALVAGPITGMGVGFAAGLLQGGLDGGAVGGSAAVLTVVGYAAGALQARLFLEHWAVPVAAVGLLTLAAEGVRGVLWRPEGWTWPAAALALVGSVLFNAALAYPAFALARRARRLLPGAAPLR